MPPSSSLELAFVDHPGGAPAVMALHGLASTSHWWDLVAPRLPSRLIAPDLRGHGLSPRPDDGFDPATVALDVVALLDRLGISEAVVVGHSWGATVATRLAVDHPHRVLGLALVDGGIGDIRARFPGGWPEAEVALRPPDMVGVPAERIAEFGRRGPASEGTDPDTAAAILGSLFEPVDPEHPEAGVRPRLRLERHMAIARHLFETDTDALLARVTVPVAAVLASVGPPEWVAGKREGAARAQEILGDRLTVTWIDGGHDLPVQRPAEVASALMELIARCL